MIFKKKNQMKPLKKEMLDLQIKYKNLNQTLMNKIKNKTTKKQKFQMINKMKMIWICKRLIMMS